MKLLDKIVVTCVLLPIICAAFVVSLNGDMYAKVENYGALSGYSALAEHLKDSTWVEATAESWETSSSPVLRSLFFYLTNQSDEDPTELILDNRDFIAFTMFLSMMCAPLYIFGRAIHTDNKRLKEYRTHE